MIYKLYIKLLTINMLSPYSEDFGITLKCPYFQHTHKKIFHSSITLNLASSSILSCVHIPSYFPPLSSNLKQFLTNLHQFILLKIISLTLNNDVIHTFIYTTGTHKAIFTFPVITPICSYVYLLANIGISLCP